ncbi:RsiV family protein [Ralstonia sp. UBA689]|uniref:RsiV family protein n=1 Tax=Ralstonia sp. UBA689 TaxID=1947373 RepID=UPI0025E9B31E|nr:RsiV family protein [Ralstonia sp. UBA689]
MQGHAVCWATQESVGAGVFVTLMATVCAMGSAHATGEATSSSSAVPAGAPAASTPVASAPTGSLAKPTAPRERHAGTFWQGTVGQGADSPSWNVWLNVYDPPPKAQDQDKDPVADTLTGDAYDDRPQGRTLWAIEGRNAPDRRFVWRERADTVDASGQPVVREGGTLSGALSADGATATGTWSDGGRSQPFTLKRAARYREVTGTSGQATLTERYPVTGDAAVDALVQSLRVGRCDPYDTECVIRISAVDLGDTVSLLRMVWAYSGGAHGNYGFSAGNWRRGAQGFQPITLADVLNPTPACLQRFNAQIIDALKREGAPEATRGALVERDLRNAAFPFTLQGDRIVVHYGPYEVGPYSSGAFRAAVRLDDLGAACKRPTT